MKFIRKYWWLIALNEIRGAIMTAPIWISYFHWMKGVLT